jgi:hypothetical protein
MNRTDYFALARSLAQRYRDQMVKDALAGPYVVVDRPIGPSRHAVTTSSFSRCVADEIEPGVLSVISIADGFVMQEFRAGTWTEGRVYTAQGMHDYTVRPSEGPVAMGRTA